MKKYAHVFGLSQLVLSGVVGQKVLNIIMYQLRKNVSYKFADRKSIFEQSILMLLKAIFALHRTPV